MSRNLYNFYSADGTFYPSQKKNVTIENFTSGPQVIETFFGETPRYFKLKTGDKFLKIIEETVDIGKGPQTTYNLIESDNESSIFTYNNNRILTAEVSENLKAKSILVTNRGSRLIITGAGGNGLKITQYGGSEFTAAMTSQVGGTLKWKHKFVNLVLNMIDFTSETDNLLNTVRTATAAVETAQGPFDTAQGDLTAAQAAFDTAQDKLTPAQTALQNATAAVETAQSTFNTAQGNLTAAQGTFNTAQDAFETAQGNLTDAQNDLTDAQTAFENA